MHHGSVLASLTLASIVLVAIAEPGPDPGPEPSVRRRDPPLVLAVGPIVGPHAEGSGDCRAEQFRCESKGAFLGTGAQVELRGRIWRPLYVHVRPFVVGNVSKNEHVYAGAWGLGLGFGYYHRRVFLRAEYTFFDAFGSHTFEAPFGEGQRASDVWSQHAGMIAVGFRMPIRRFAIELWGGPLIGPHAVRRFPQAEPDPRTLVSFVVGVQFAVNVIEARTEPPRRREPRG